MIASATIPGVPVHWKMVLWQHLESFQRRWVEVRVAHGASQDHHAVWIRLPGTVTFRRTTYLILMSALTQRTGAAHLATDVRVASTCLAANADVLPWWFKWFILFTVITLLGLGLAVLWLRREMHRRHEENDIPPLELVPDVVAALPPVQPADPAGQWDPVDDVAPPVVAPGRVQFPMRDAATSLFREWDVSLDIQRVGQMTDRDLDRILLSIHAARTAGVRAYEKLRNGIMAGSGGQPL